MIAQSPIDLTAVESDDVYRSAFAIKEAQLQPVKQFNDFSSREWLREVKSRDVAKYR